MRLRLRSDSLVINPSNPLFEKSIPAMIRSRSRLLSRDKEGTKPGQIAESLVHVDSLLVSTSQQRSHVKFDSSNICRDFPTTVGAHRGACACRCSDYGGSSARDGRFRHRTNH